MTLPSVALALIFAAPTWREVAPGVLATSHPPFAYLLVDGQHGLLIGAPDDVSPATLPADRTCELVLLTHHHRDSVGGAAAFLAAGVPVRAPATSAPWLSPAGVAEFWDRSLPSVVPGRFPPLFARYWGQWNYFVVPEGLAGVRCDVRDGEAFDWRGWRLEAQATPGHSPDHHAYLARRGDAAPFAFCGDAFHRRGTIWTPFTMEWHHQKSEGLEAAAESLRALAAKQPAMLFPEHGPPVSSAGEVQQALADTALELAEAARRKHFDRYTAALPPAPKYRFVAADQAGTANPEGNPRPWSKLSPHLFLTGNTYAIASRDGPLLLVDPYGPNLPQRIDELRREHGCGPVEAVVISHAHNDHYNGIFALPERAKFAVWTLDRIADVVDEPHRLRAPYVDPRRPCVDRRLRDGESVTWHEHTLKVHHLPGQTEFALGLELVLDGRRVFFTGDHFFHVDLYSGTGGWSGRNRGLPLGYATTAQRLLDAEPAWVLAEHGGAFEFHRDDLTRRRDWARAAARAADRLSPSGSHGHDWSEHSVRFEPAIAEVRPGTTCRVEIVATNATEDSVKCRLTLLPGAITGEPVEWTTARGETTRRPFVLHVPASLARRTIVPARVTWNESPCPADVFVVLERREGDSADR